MTPVASLPMYDWPEVRKATDRFWALLRDALRSAGIAAPEVLARDHTHWTNPHLVLSQTCGMPFRLGLHARVTLIGAPDYGLEGCPPGFYRSALVVRAQDKRETAAQYAGARFAFNAQDSQSGFAALAAAVGPLEADLGLRTGAHRESIRAVAAGSAEIAAIDAVTWRLASAWEPAARAVRILGWTEPMPGLPIIAGPGREPAPFAQAISGAIAALDVESRMRLGLVGFVPMLPEVYVDLA